LKNVPTATAANASALSPQAAAAAVSANAWTSAWLGTVTLALMYAQLPLTLAAPPFVTFTLYYLWTLWSRKSAWHFALAPSAFTVSLLVMLVVLATQPTGAITPRINATTGDYLAFTSLIGSIAFGLALIRLSLPARASASPAAAT